MSMSCMSLCLQDTRLALQKYLDSGSVEEGMCMPMMMGDECVNHCPVYCPMDQMMCPGGMDYNGDSLEQSI